MSDPESKPAIPQPPAAVQRRARRIVLWTTVCIGVLLLGVVVAFLFWAASSAPEDLARRRLVGVLEQATGGKVEIRSFHWHLFDLEAEAEGVAIHGLEGPGEAPWAQVERLRTRLSVRDIWSARIVLRELEVYKPGFHLIVYADGSTNQPRPRKPGKPGRPALDTIFDLEAGHVGIEQGTLAFQNQAMAFDFQNRYTLLNFDARDVSLRMTYVPSAKGTPESYRIEAGAADMDLSRGEARGKGRIKELPPVEGYAQATLDLQRNAAYLRSLRVTSRGPQGQELALSVSGSLLNFARPRWEGKVSGDLDMRLIDPITGFPWSPAGSARLDLAGAGQGAQFRIDGPLHIEGGEYSQPGVTATGVELDAHVHADPEQLLFTSVVLRPREGGQVEGVVALDHWLPPIPGAATFGPASHAGKRASTARPPVAPIHPAPVFIPVSGKVTAELKDVSLDTVLDIVGQEPFQRVGLDARLNGPATATWSNGNPQTTVVSVNLSVDPTGNPEAGEVSATGAIDATYTQRNGTVDLRKLELRTPASLVEAHGELGVFPVTNPTSLAVNLQSRNLEEFDTALRELGLNRNGKSGTAALPFTLAGEANFHGSWAGSLADPALAGSLTATHLAIELPAKPGDKTSRPQTVHWDTAGATGSYSSERIVVENGLLRRGKTEIAVNGTLVAPLGSTPGRMDPIPVLGTNSVLHLRLHATKVALEEWLPLAGENLAVTGPLEAQLEAEGPLHTLNGSGWAELDGGTVFGEPVSRIRVQGTLANQTVKLGSLTINEAKGNISATGSYDLKSRRFQLETHGADIDVSSLESLSRNELDVTGKLGFAITGSGTLDDPHLEGHANLTGLAVEGESLGGLEVTAYTANRAVLYSATTRLATAELFLNGQTALSSPYASQAHLEFSRFNIGALLKMARVEGLSGESALAGTVDLDGPLSRTEQLRGEARLRELAVTISGVHLKSEGGVHATLAEGLVRLDPLHVTGEETDLHAQGSLSLIGTRQLDLAASGSINLKLAQTLDSDLTAAGTTTFQVEAHGPLSDPGLQGRIDFQNASLALEDVPNGLSQLHGTLEFNQNRLEVKTLTAMSGGGLLSVAGYLAYQHGLYGDLTVTGNGIRIRYPAGVSSLADATLRLQGPQNNLQLTGDVRITRFSVSPDLDLAALAAQANTVQSIAPPDAPSNHIRLNIHVVSSPQLNFQNAFAKLAGDVDLRLRGTVASPSLLGRVSITEGSATIAGTRYELQRGEMTFTNPVRIEPLIDLNATARVSDYDITLGLHGTPEKMDVTYRSDPPLPEADVVALLALGRTENEQRLYTEQQEQTGANATTDLLLGGALNATVSSRVQKLFGAGSVKVDPNYLGALGNSTSRIIVEEQLGRYLTLTYATNVDTTQQQLIQAEIAINRHVSLLVARDESGVFSMVVKATRRYR
jgi:translocation and assembly module TamB